MEYVLGVGFACKIYKKNPSIRLFIDDILIDEFELDTSYDIKNFSSTKRIVESLIGEIDRNFPKSFIVPIKIKLYTLKPNIHFQQNSTVVFDINNLDSNYTNGFLTRSTLININALFLLPKIFFRNNCSLLKDFWKKTNDIERAKRCVEYFKINDLKCINPMHYNKIKKFTGNKKVDLDYTNSNNRTEDIDIMVKINKNINSPYADKIGRIIAYNGDGRFIVMVGVGKIVAPGKFIDPDPESFPFTLFWPMCNRVIWKSNNQKKILALGLNDMPHRKEVVQAIANINKAKPGEYAMVGGSGTIEAKIYKKDNLFFLNDKPINDEPFNVSERFESFLLSKQLINTLNED